MSDVDSHSVLSDYSSSPSPPPPSRKQPKASAISAGLDSSSELSELTEDEQEGTTRSSSASNANNTTAKKKRGSIVPAPMWDWAYKGKKPADNDDNSKPPLVQQQLVDAVATVTADVQDNEDEKAAVDGPSEKASLADGATVDDADDSGEPPEGKLASAAVNNNEDSHDETDEEDTTLPARAKIAIREGSTELTDVDEYESDASMTEEDVSQGEEEQDDEGESEPESESDAHSASDNEPEDPPVPDAPDAAAEPEPEEEIPEDAPTEPPAEPVVPAAPAGSSIMAGQQLIKTPTPSPSPSPEPEEAPGADVDAPDVDPEIDAEPEAEVEAEPEVDIDLAENGEAEAEAEADEAELDLQPAHRAEALDVLAGIELRFALLRERLYVEKMEDLAMEEAMVLQGIHPEMIHLQNELQVRHDRRLDLAGKKRQREDGHVSLMRKVEDDAVWSWWKFERDQLQTDMYAEANRKRRKLEREKRLIERPLPVRRIPPPPPFRHQTRPLTFRDVLKNSSLESTIYRPTSVRKRKDQLATFTTANPQLNTLNSHEINADLQIISSHRAPAMYNQQPVHPLDVGVGMGVPPGVGVGVGMGPYGVSTPGHELPPQIEYVQANPQLPMGYGMPGGPPPMQAYNAPGQNRQYHHVGGAPPLGSLPVNNSHHGRPVQGPGMNANSGPRTMSPYLGSGPRNGRRSPSLPPSANYPHGSMNGVGPYGEPGMQNGIVAGPSSLKQQQHQGGLGANVNGWNNERDKQRERENRRERKLERERGREREQREREQRVEWPEEDRPHIPRHNSQISPQGQGVPHHHHHVVHAHGAPHHHHHPAGSSSGAAPSRVPHHHPHVHSHQHQLGSSRRHELERHPHNPDLDSVANASGSSNNRRLGHAHPHVHAVREGRDGQHMHVHPHGPIEDVPRSRRAPVGGVHDNDMGPGWERERITHERMMRERDRDRDRDREQPMSHLGAPPSTRPPVTQFVMTPSQTMQEYGPGLSPTRRDTNTWIDEVQSQPSNHRRQMGESRNHRPLSPPPRHAHAQSPPPPPRRGAPQDSPPMSAGPGAYPPGPGQNHIHSPTSRHIHSPRAYNTTSGPATPKGGPRPISPVPAKMITQQQMYGSPLPPPPSAGPGTPGGEGRIRLGTPGLTGPGSRATLPESGVQPPNGHGPVFPAVSALQSANASSDSGRGLPPPRKMSIVQLGNGS